jgi:hypothetical protein
MVTPVIVDPATAPAAGAETPKMPIENLNPKKFDDAVGKKPTGESQKQ